MSVYVPQWLQDTFDRAQRDLERVPNESLPSWLQHVELGRALSAEPETQPLERQRAAVGPTV